jgi:chromate transporter
MSFDAPLVSSVEAWALVLAVVAGFSLFRFKLGVMPTLAICSAASLGLHFALGSV